MDTSIYFPCPITDKSYLDNLYEKHGVDCAVELGVASTDETPDTIQEEYCGAYISYFLEWGLSF